MRKKCLCQLNETPQALACVGLDSKGSIRFDLLDKGGQLEDADKRRHALRRLT